MARNRIKGITVEIGGDTTKLDKALESSNKTLSQTQKALKAVERLLKLDPAVLTILREGGCTERHARALLRLEDPAQQREAAQQVTERSLTVAQTESMVEAMLSSPSSGPKKKPTFIVKDVRLFLNTISRSLDLMRSAGVNACCRREDTDEEILLTIHIPRRAT